MQIEVSEKELLGVIRLAVAPLMERRGVARHLQADGDFYVSLRGNASTMWHVTICDLHGGDDYARASADNLLDAIASLRRTLEG